MTTQKSKLLLLLADLDRDDELFDRLDLDPISIFREYELSDAEIALLRSRDQPKIEAALAEGATALLRSLISSRIILGIPWPGAHPSVAQCGPSSGEAGSSISFRITGMFFYKNCSLLFESPNAKVVATDVEKDCRLKDGNSWLTANATFEIAGDYDVIVEVRVGQHCERATLPRGFTVRAAH